MSKLSAEDIRRRLFPRTESEIEAEQASAEIEAALAEAERRSNEFLLKDSGERQEFASGMVRDTANGKTQYIRVFDGVLVKRLADHLTKGAAKYPDVKPGVPNWLLANGQAEAERFKASAARHFVQWLHGEHDEDHFAATVFNMNGYETVKSQVK